MSNLPDWFKHLDCRQAPPADRAFAFRELRLPKIQPAYRNYAPRPEPAIPMFATDIRPQPPAIVPPVRSYEQGATGDWSSPEPEKKAAHLTRARRRTKKPIDLTDHQAAEIRQGLTEIVEAGRLMGANEEETE